MPHHPILVTGGTGKSGGRVVAQLQNKDIEVRVGSRTGAPPFDWSDRSTWDAVLDGVATVYIVPLDGELLTRPFVRLCEQRGVKRVVLLSGRGVDVPDYAGENSAAGATHIDGENAVRTCTMEWTIVRPAWFAQNFSEGFFLESVLSGELRLPAGDGAATFTDAEDIAAVAVAALTEDRHHCQTYEVSGPRALTFTEVAQEISHATGRSLQYVAVPEEQFVDELIEQGWHRPDAEDYATTIGSIRRGLDSHVSDGVHRALGRSPRDFTEFVNRSAQVWQS